VSKLFKCPKIEWDGDSKQTLTYRIILLLNLGVSLHEKLKSIGGIALFPLVFWPLRIGLYIHDFYKRESKLRASKHDFDNQINYIVVKSGRRIEDCRKKISEKSRKWFTSWMKVLCGKKNSQTTTFDAFFLVPAAFIDISSSFYLLIYTFDHFLNLFWSLT